MAVLEDAMASGEDGQESTTDTKAAALLSNRQRKDKHYYERALYLSLSLYISLCISLFLYISLYFQLVVRSKTRPEAGPVEVCSEKSSLCVG